MGRLRIFVGQATSFLGEIPGSCDLLCLRLFVFLWLFFREYNYFLTELHLFILPSAICDSGAWHPREMIMGFLMR